MLLQSHEIPANDLIFKSASMISKIDFAFVICFYFIVDWQKQLKFIFLYFQETFYTLSDFYFSAAKPNVSRRGKFYCCMLKVDWFWTFQFMVRIFHLQKLKQKQFFILSRQFGWFMSLVHIICLSYVYCATCQHSRVVLEFVFAEIQTI